MFNENHQNQSCNAAEELVSYLYNELGSADKSRFETHLKTCRNCTDELTSFNFVHSEVINWRDQEFAPLATPIIEIPFEQKVQPVVVVSDSRSWVVAFREYFSLSPIWMTASTAMAAVAIFIGLGFILLSSSENNKGELVQEDKGNVKPVVSPTSEAKKVEPIETNSGQTNSDSRDSLIQSKSSDATKTGSSSVKITERQVVKSQNSTTKKNAVTTVENKTKVAPKSNKKAKMPSLTGDDDEDEAISLSDLFDEIGDDKKK